MAAVSALMLPPWKGRWARIPAGVIHGGLTLLDGAVRSRGGEVLPKRRNAVADHRTVAEGDSPNDDEAGDQWRRTDIGQPERIDTKPD